MNIKIDGIKTNIDLNNKSHLVAEEIRQAIERMVADSRVVGVVTTDGILVERV